MHGRPAIHTPNTSMYPMYVLMCEWLYEAWNGASLLAISYLLVLPEVSLDGDGDIALPYSTTLYHTLPYSTIVYHTLPYSTTLYFYK